MHPRNSDNIAIAKPKALSLLTHILRATVLDGMQWPVLFSIVLASALYHFDIAHHASLTILLITGVLVSGLLRGCIAWQNDMNDYQRRLALARHRHPDAEQHKGIPGYFPSRRY